MRLAALLIFGVLSTAAAWAQAPDFAGTFPVNGRNMYIECFGTGAPTVMLMPGEGSRAQDYREETVHLGKVYKACSYNRVRFDSITTAEVVTADLRGLLEAAAIDKPFLLVGHSAGGMMVQHYAKTYPEELIGLVAINQVPPAAPWLDAVESIFSPQDFAGELAYFNGDNDEPFDYATSSAQIVALPTPDMPFEVVQSTSKQCEGDPLCISANPTETRIISELAASWPRGNFTSVDAFHNIPVEEVLAAVERVLAAD